MDVSSIQLLLTNLTKQTFIMSGKPSLNVLKQLMSVNILQNIVLHTAKKEEEKEEKIDLPIDVPPPIPEYLEPLSVDGPNDFFSDKNHEDFNQPENILEFQDPQQLQNEIDLPIDLPIDIPPPIPAYLEPLSVDGPNDFFGDENYEDFVQLENVFEFQDPQQFQNMIDLPIDITRSRWRAGAQQT